MKTVLFWGLFPFVLPQALHVRKNAPRFAAATGPKEGTVGHGQPYTLYAVGDSLIAGVGASQLTDALVGQVAIALAGELNGQVNWVAQGSIGARTEKVVQRLAPGLPAVPADFIVISTGVNDITALEQLNKWLKELDALITALQTHSPQAIIAMAGIPPLRGFPLLPQPLRALFGIRAEIFDNAARHLFTGYERAIYVPYDVEPGPDQFSADGYHPNEASYQKMGEFIARQMADAHQKFRS
jgi:lysophospholipase L1-like esterase